MGHEDIVIEIPPQATLLASSKKVTNQAYRFNDAPIYCTQFHPELNRSDLLRRCIIREEMINRQELRKSARIYPVNALRKWRRAVLLPD
jgi:GMP synthase-like glutamine amidotransferase